MINQTHTAVCQMSRTKRALVAVGGILTSITHAPPTPRLPPPIPRMFSLQPLSFLRLLFAFFHESAQNAPRDNLKPIRYAEKEQHWLWSRK